MVRVAVSNVRLILYRDFRAYLISHIVIAADLCMNDVDVRIKLVERLNVAIENR